MLFLFLLSTAGSAAPPGDSKKIHLPSATCQITKYGFTKFASDHDWIPSHFVILVATRMLRNFPTASHRDRY